MPPTSTSSTPSGRPRGTGAAGAPPAAPPAQAGAGGTARAGDSPGTAGHPDSSQPSPAAGSGPASGPARAVRDRHPAATGTATRPGAAAGSGLARPAPRGNRHWPWLPFVDLAVAAALVPGFFLGGLLAAAAWRGWSLQAAYPALAQAHGHAQLLGWGGALILGVALHFLPRLRGGPLARPGAVPPLFALLATGLGLRVTGQVVAALAAAGGGHPPGSGAAAAGAAGAASAPAGSAVAGNAAAGSATLGAAGTAGAAAGSGPALQAAGAAAMAAGAILELAAAAGLVALLATSLRAGPPLGQKRAFAQVVPLFAVSGASLLAALAFWAAGAVAAAAGATPLLPPAADVPALRLALFGFIGAVCVAMSGRVFGLFFRVRPPSPAALRAAGILFALGATLELINGAVQLATGRPLAAASGVAALAWGLGLGTGAWAVRVFHPRVEFPGDRGRYRLWRDPAGLAAAGAYAWAVLAGLLLVLQGLGTWGIRVAPGPVPADAAIHATGAGFMTLLILAVAPTMLPGFAGSRPQGRGWVWAAVLLGTAAAVLRVAPGMAVWLTGDAPPWGSAALSLAGAAGLLAVLALVAALRQSWSGAAG